MAFPFVYCQLAGFYFSIVLLHATIAAAATANFVIRTNPGNETDRIALLAFKQKISQDPNGVMSSWNLSKDFCEWEGITCSRRHRRVTMLNLRSRRLVGSLSPYIGNLSFLREIRLENNTLHGEIPEEVGRLFRLRFLYLGNNSLVGQIPVNLSHCSKLSFLHLGRNKLVGKFPLEFASLSNLKELAIHFNHLTGGIPPFLANISSLEALSASYNAFGGNIPDSLGQLRYLTSLGLGGNNISGTIPPSLYNLSSLAIFSLSENRLRGRLPSNLGLALPNLRRFQISVNFFSGSIPVSLSNASKLEFIEMVGNNLSGKLSVDFGGMQQLSYLNLGRNDLGSGEPDEMRFIDSLANCSNLQDLDLSVNRFQGVLPHSSGNLSTQLLRLLLDSNQLYGTIPSGLVIQDSVGAYMNCSCPNATSTIVPRNKRIPSHLRMALANQVMDIVDPTLLNNGGELAAENNRLRHSNSDRIKECLISVIRIGVACSMESPQERMEISNAVSELQMVKKALVGPRTRSYIQTALAIVQNSRVIHLNFNKLRGRIPEELSNLPKVIALHIAANNLTGGITPFLGNLSTLLNLSLARNNLGGSIPDDLGRLASLNFLQAGSNNLSGIIPASILNLSVISIFAAADNKLTGSFPQSLGTNFPNLQIFAVGVNRFTGPIPPTLSNATGLLQIDFPDNYFVGRMPTDLGSIKNLQRLNVGRNRLGSREADDLSFLNSLINCSKLQLLGIDSNNFGGV
ncbi:hypothetical protein SCA6_000167 [Theobroma cacao]